MAVAKPTYAGLSINTMPLGVIEQPVPSSGNGSTSTAPTISNGCDCAWWDVVCLAQCAGSDISSYFQNAPTYISKGVLPYLQTLPTIGGYLTQMSAGMSSGFASLESGIADIPEIGAGVAAIYATAKYLPSAISKLNNLINPAINAILNMQSGVMNIEKMSQSLLNLPSQIETDLTNIIPALRSDFGKIENYLREFVQVPTNVSQILTLSEEIEQDVTNIRQEFPVEITTIENYMANEITALESWMRNNLTISGLQSGINDIEQGISTIEKDLSKIANEIKNLPKDVEKYVEQGVDTALEKLWKKIEIPALIIGGFAFLLWIQPSDCCPRQPYRPHIPTG